MRNLNDGQRNGWREKMKYNCCSCGTPLEDINEPCPNCLPGMAWRPPTRPTFNELDELKKENRNLRYQLERMRNDRSREN
jgi:hypothetical protein